MDASTILEVTQKLIGATEPYGDSAIDCKRIQNLDTLIHVIDALLDDVLEAANYRDRHERSMRDIGRKAHKALQEWRNWIDSYMREGDEGEL